MRDSNCPNCLELKEPPSAALRSFCFFPVLIDLTGHKIVLRLWLRKVLPPVDTRYDLRFFPLLDHKVPVKPSNRNCRFHSSQRSEQHASVPGPREFNLGIVLLGSKAHMQIHLAQ